MALTYNHFSNVWDLGANELVGTELPVSAGSNPNVGTYGFRTIGIPVASCLFTEKCGAYLTAVNGDANRDNSEVLWIEPLVQETCTFTDAGDLVTRTAHGRVNDDIVNFAVVNTTTGITSITEYYVVNATANTFQVSDTIGGAAKALTNNGTGVILPWYESGAMVRGSGAAGAEDAYLCWFDMQSTNLVIGKFDAGTWITLAYINYPIPTADACDYYIRFRVDGSSLKAKIWPYYDYEPAAWTVQTTDTSITGVGYVGFWSFALTDNKAGFNTPGFISVATNQQTAPMPRSDKEISAWLRDEGNARVVLAEVGVLAEDSTSPGTENPSFVLLSNWPYVTGINETPSAQCYDDLIIDVPTLRSQAGEALMGRSSMSYGDLAIDNSDGLRDDWLTWNWDGRDLDLYLGGVGWRKWDFTRVLTATVGEIYAPSRNKLGFKIRDRAALLNRVLQDEKIDEGGVNDGNFRPIVFGKVFNIEPVLVDPGTLTYMFHTGSMAGATPAITAVRDGGISVGTEGVDYTEVLASGAFTLAAAPEYRVTIDVTNDLTDSSVTKSGNTHRRAIETIVEHRIGLGDNSTYQGLRNGSLALFGTDAIIGMYVKGDENAMDLLDKITISAGGFWYFNSLGLVCAQQLVVPTAPYEHELIEDDVVDFIVEKLILPSEVEQLGYQKNWTVQKDGLAGAVTESDRALYGAPAQYTAIAPSYSGLDQPSKHNLRKRPRPRDTLFYSLSDAQTEATRLDALYRKLTAIVSFKPVTDGLKFDLGQSVLLTHSRFGFSAGKAGIIVGIEKNFSRATATVRMFVQYDGQFAQTAPTAPYVGAEEFY